jgi:AcrR family transcriptional regulator
MFAMPRALSEIEVADFRDRLCEAAGRIFAEKGLAGFTMRELAAALGVSPMTPYRYFKDKEEILAAVRAKAFDDFSAAMETAFNAVPPGDPIAQAGGAGGAYVDFAFAHPESYRLMFEISQSEDGTHADLERATERARASMTRHVDVLVESGLLHGDPVLIGHVFWAALHGAVMLKLAGKLTPEYDFDIVSRTLMRAVTEGLAGTK